MPNPVLLNLWACNPWQRDVPLEAAGNAVPAAASETPAVDLAGPPVTTAVYPDPIPPDPAAYHAELTADWPEVGPVIAEADHVDGQVTGDVLEFNNARPGVTQRTVRTVQCFNYAEYQMHVAGFRTTGRPSEENGGYLVFVEIPGSGGVTEETRTDATYAAVSYIKEALAESLPVLVGIRMAAYSPRPNDQKITNFIEPTNHFVVLVGMGQDAEEFYFSNYDYLHAPRPTDRFYLREDMSLVSPSLSRIAQVRRTYR